MKLCINDVGTTTPPFSGFFSSLHPGRATPTLLNNNGSEHTGAGNISGAYFSDPDILKDASRCVLSTRL